MWAVIGIYGGGEDNIFWRRTEDGIEAAGAEAIRTGDAVPLGPSIVHSVTNPLDKFTGAIHVYGGDFFAAERSEWDPENFAEMPYSMEETKRLFSEANARHKALATA
jgi:predicted metal-dependent enzyme (double-stranded beta helix superfamily)